MKKSVVVMIMTTALVACFAFSFFSVIEVNGQSRQSTSPPSNRTSVSTSTPTTVPTPTVTFTFDQQAGDLLKTYKEVLETSNNAVDEVHTTANNAIEEVHTTANNVLDFVKTLFVALTIGGLGGAGLLSWFGQRASDKANVAQQKATNAFDLIQKIEGKTRELEERNGTAQKVADELGRKHSDLMSKIATAEKSLGELQVEINQVKSLGEKDRQVLKRPLILMQIDDYGMQLLSGSPDEKVSSISSLIELSARPDPVVRRMAVKALGVFDEYDERLAKRLSEIIETDSAQGVRKEAEKSLKLLEAKKPKKKTTRRKS